MKELKPWQIVHQNVDTEIVDSLHRRRVEGGWLYRSLIIYKDVITQNMIFVPFGNKEQPE